MIHKHQQTQCISIRETNRLAFLREITALIPKFIGKRNHPAGRMKSFGVLKQSEYIAGYSKLGQLLNRINFGIGFLFENLDALK
jgi:hypothetical protein